MPLPFLLLALSALASACFPQCVWMCDDPACAAHCVPVCDPPRCQVGCEEGVSNATCAEPSCRIRCPEDMCASDVCPACETVCDPVECPGVEGCSPLCEQTTCSWACETPTDCAAPTCVLQCEHPACETNSTEVCPPGSWYNATSLVCTPCPAGRYSATQFAAGCLPCDEDYEPNPYQTACVRSGKAAYSRLEVGLTIATSLASAAVLVLAAALYWTCERQASVSRLK